ncbi:MAG TPA: AMP-binding protein, partial [Trebonia sp.]
MSLLARWRDLTPDAVAVSGPGGDLSYAELHRRVTALAGVLRERGVRPETPVGLCLERTTGMLVAVLAVWAAGGAYVPLDPAFPEDRLRLMREDAGIRLVLTQPGVDPRLVAGVPEVLTISEGGLAEPGAEPGIWPYGELAYLMYTSGSTGRPKGVAVPHRAVTHLLESFADTLKPAPGDVWLAVTTLSFDISVLELLLPLACGARVVIAADTAD